MLYVHRAERSDALAAALGTLLAAPSGDPFQAEIVAVPSKGVERWLAQRLSSVLGAVDGDGVCANVIFPPSARLFDEAIGAADPGFADSVERWSAERTVWPLLSVIESSVPAEPGAQVLAAHVGPGGDHNGRRFAVAAKLARLFDAYSRDRPTLLNDWQAGLDEQGDGSPLPPDLLWQAEIWRRLREHLGPSPADLLADVCRRIAADPNVVDLPARFSIFGATRLPPSRIRVLAALAEGREVHLWLQHPSPALWRAVADVGGGSRRRSDDDTARHLAHPLLRALSRDIREFQMLLPGTSTATHHATGPRPATLLGRLQTQLADDKPPPRRRPIDAGDRSLTVHACHGRSRQVEVVREVILGLLAADPTLEPRDILIMCPDVETFAPLVAATFGMPDERDGHPAARLRVKIADRSLRQTNPLLKLLDSLLELAASRITATQVLDLAGQPPVRARFGFSDDDLERMRNWATAANARWGLDAGHRAPFGLAGVSQGTWRAAVDRLLVGVAMDEGDRFLGSVLPLDDVDSGDIDLVGRFAELLDRLDATLRALDEPRTVAQWSAVLPHIVSSLGAATVPWHETQLRSELADVAESASGTDAVLDRRDVAALLGPRLAGRPTRAGFRTGTLTVCTLVPMRSIPHRVVCLVGMDDGAFPRQGVTDGDDVLLRAPRIGERDVRSEDRQLFLDAICAAQEHLVITYTGADPRTGAVVPPCVPVGELLDAIDASATAPDGRPASEYVVTHHPLQPFDSRNFTPGELGTDGPFSFDPSGLAGARAASGPRVAEPPLVPRPLPAAGNESLAVDDLVRFVQHPARAFLRQRLAISTYDDETDPADSLPVELEPLREWAIGDRVFRDCLAGASPQTCVEAELRRGDLPPGPIGRRALQRIGHEVEALLTACDAERALNPESLDVTVTLPDGRRLTGTIPGVRGRTVLAVGYSKLAAKHRLEAWIRHLCAVIALDDAGLESLTIGRHSRGVRRTLLSGVDVAAAHRHLADLVAMRDDGLRAPLPMALATSEAYAERRYRGSTADEARDAARQAWESGNFCENAQPEHVLVFGRRLTLAELMAEKAAVADETTRFGVLARRLWTPLLRAETDGAR